MSELLPISGKSGPKPTYHCPDHGRYSSDELSGDAPHCLWYECSEHGTWLGPVMCPGCVGDQTDHDWTKCGHNTTIATQHLSVSLSLDCVDRRDVELVADGLGVRRSVWMRALVRRFIPNGPEGAHEIIERIIRATGEALVSDDPIQLAQLIVAALSSPPEVSSFEGWAERNLGDGS